MCGTCVKKNQHILFIQRLRHVCTVVLILHLNINDMRVCSPFFSSRQMLPVGIQRTTLQFVTGVSVHTRHTRHSNEMRNVCVCVCVCDTQLQVSHHAV